MSVRPSGFKKGGKLNDVDVTFVGYEFQSKTFTAKKGEHKGEEFTPMSVELQFLVDGADEPVKTWLKMGDAENWGEISEDGLSLGIDEGQSLSANSQLGTFISSAVAAGFPEDELDDDPTRINLEAMLNRRYRVAQNVNAEKTERFGQEVNRKTGQKYDRRDFVVTKYYGPVGAAASSKKGGGASTKGGSTKAAGKPNGKVAEPNIDALALETLLAVLADAGGSIARAKVAGAVTRKLGLKHPQRDAVAKLIYSDEFLGTQQGFSYDAADKSQLITLDGVA